MLRIIDSNDSGKTRKLLEEISKDPNSIIVCKHPERIVDKCINYGVSIVDAISYQDFLEIIKNDDANPSPRRKVYIDELEAFMKVCCKQFEGYTLTNE